MRSRISILVLVCSLLATLALGGCKKAPPPAPPSHGAELYGRMCVVCHGANGEGYKADSAPRLAEPGFQASVTDDYLTDAITNGRTGTTMSAWFNGRGGPLSREDIADVVKFMRDSWSKAPRATLDEHVITGDAARGENTYARECFRCHGTKGVSGPNLHIGNPQLLQTATNGFLRYAIRTGRSGTLMPTFTGKLSDGDIEDVVALLRQWAAPPPPPPAPARPPPIPLGPVPLNPKGPEPVGFKAQPATTPADVIHHELERGAKMVIMDARAPSDYMNEHIAGSVSVPFYDPAQYFEKLPKNAWLVCYCACPHAESGMLAGKLLAAGFKKVTVLDEGLNYWRTKKYGTHTGEKP